MTSNSLPKRLFRLAHCLHARDSDIAQLVIAERGKRLTLARAVDPARKQREDDGGRVNGPLRAPGRIGLRRQIKVECRHALLLCCRGEDGRRRGFLFWLPDRKSTR